MPDLETKTLQGVKGENSLSSTGSFFVDNSSIDFQKFPDKEILRISGPLAADFTVKVRVRNETQHKQTKKKTPQNNVQASEGPERSPKK